MSSGPRDSLLPARQMEATYTLDRTGSVSEGLPLMEIEEGDDSTFLTEAPAASQVGKMPVDCLLQSGLK